MTKKILTVLGLLTVLGTTETARAEVITTNDYKAIRRKMREDDLTEFQAKRVCDRLEGYRVNFSSTVISVRASGTIVADIDGHEILSVPEITIYLANTDQADSLRTGQDITYRGQISDCSFNRTTGTLSLDVSDARLQLHY